MVKEDTSKWAKKPEPNKTNEVEEFYEPFGNNIVNALTPKIDRKEWNLPPLESYLSRTIHHQL